MTLSDIHSLYTELSAFENGTRERPVAAWFSKLIAAQAARRAERAVIDHLRTLDAHQLDDLGIDAAALRCIVPHIRAAVKPE